MKAHGYTKSINLLSRKPTEIESLNEMQSKRVVMYFYEVDNQLDLLFSDEIKAEVDFENRRILKEKLINLGINNAKTIEIL